MSFAYPLVLLGLLAVPVLICWYVGQQRRRTRTAAAFVAAPLVPSLVPQRPRWRRHAPMLLFALALAALILAAARPERTVAAPVDAGAIMLANDVSSSMLATDVEPSRLSAARRAAARFIGTIPRGIEVGLLEFATKVTVLQSPTSDHALTRGALAQLRPHGGTAIGDAILTALRVLADLPRRDGKRLPSAILLLSDGASNAGTSPLAAARQAAAEHVPVYTVALGTPHGTIPIKRGTSTVITPVPPSPEALAQVAQLSGGRAFTATGPDRLRAIYQHLATQLGRKPVKRELTASFAGGALVLLLAGSALSLHWFGRLV